MGFFSNIFKKKKGGTAFGNLLRGTASAFTGGALGNGSQLRKWEAEQEQKQMAQYLTPKFNPADNQHYQMANKTVNEALLPTMANNPNTDPNAGETILLTALKKYWAWVALGLTAIVAVTYYLTNRKKGGKRRF